MEACYLWIRLLAVPVEFLFDDNSESASTFSQHYLHYINWVFLVLNQKNKGTVIAFLSPLVQIHLFVVFNPNCTKRVTAEYLNHTSLVHLNNRPIIV